MSTDEREDARTYKVVINHEDQYSIWPAERPNPSGWRDGGKTGQKKDCLVYIQEVWTDMAAFAAGKDGWRNNFKLAPQLYGCFEDPAEAAQVVPTNNTIDQRYLCLVSITT